MSNYFAYRDFLMLGKKQSIFTIIGIVVIASVCGVMAVHAAITYYSTKEHIVSDNQRHASTALSSLQQNISGYMSSFMPNEYENLIQNEMQFPSIQAIVVEDKNLGSVLGGDDYVSGKIRGADGSISDFDPSNSNHQSVLLDCFIKEDGPVQSDDGEVLGKVTVCTNDQALKEALNNTIVAQSLIAGTLALVLILLLFFILYRVLLRPLSHISNSLITFSDDVAVPALPIHNEAREITALITSINTYRSQLKAQHDELEEERNRFRLAIDGSQDGLWDWNPNTNKVFFSHQWKAMLGHQDNEIDDRFEEWSSRVHPDDLESAMHNVQNHLDGKTEIYENRIRMKCKDGSWKWILARGKALFDAEGSPVRFLGFHTDITEEMEHQHELAKAHQAAENASKAKSEFLANMSHELRTPLNSIIGFAEMMAYEIKGPLPEDYHEYSTLIQSSGRLLLETINSILDLSKIEAGQFELDTDDVFMGDMIDEVLALMKVQVQEKNLDLVNATQNLHRMHVDPMRIKQVFINILGNAIKFTDSGQIKIESRCDSNGHNIIVTDTGIGMTSDQIKIAFEPFRQVHGSSLVRKHQGTGLGLSFSRQVMQLHRGDLIAESIPGKGTVMTLHFPPEAGIEPLN